MKDCYRVQRLLGGYAWEDIYVPVRILKNEEVVFEIKRKTITKTEVNNKLKNA